MVTKNVPNFFFDISTKAYNLCIGKLNFMKLKHSLGLIICFIWISASQAQNNRNLGMSKALKFNLLGPFIGSLSIQYESKLNKDASLVITGNYFKGQSDQGFNNVTGFGACLEYRYYGGNADMDGFYFQPYARYQYYKDTKLVDADATIPGVGLLFGFQKRIVKNIIVDAYYGPAYNFGSIRDGGNTVNPRDIPPIVSGYWMRGGISIGMLFN